MTAPMSGPADRTKITSTPVLRTTLIWSAVVTAVLAVIGAILGFIAAGAHGLFSALAGIILAAVFLGITGASILIANRWFGDALYVPIFFGIVLGGWLLKFVVFIVVLLVLRGQPWVEPTVFFVALVAGVLASLVIDVIVMTRMRVPAVAVDLPHEVPDEQAPGADETGKDV
jgi:hypothetical protein